MAVVRLRSADGGLTASFPGAADRVLREQDASWLVNRKLSAAAVASKGGQVFDELLRPLLEMVTSASGRSVGEGDLVPTPLRLFVHCEDSSAARQPYEAAVLPDREQFVGCSRMTVLRSTSTVSSNELWPPRTLPSVLVLNCVDPHDPQAGAAADVANVITETSHRHDVSSTVEPVGSLDDVRRHERCAEAVVHVIAHGSDGGPGSRGTFVQIGSSLVRAEEVAAALARLGAGLVVLTVCHSSNPERLSSGLSLADAVISEGLGAVVAARHALDDSLATTSAERLYDALWDGKPVDAAVNHARAAGSVAQYQSALLTLHVSTQVLHTPFGDRARRREAVESAARLSADAGRALFRVPPPPIVEGERLNPSVLLNPWYRVVPLVGRDRELAELDAWCDLPERVSVRAIVGEGGSGKTRLALHHVDRTNRRPGWRAGVLAPDIDPVSLLDAINDDVELVVDYAESSFGTHYTSDATSNRIGHQALVSKLIEAARRRRARTRIVLCVRQRSANRGWLSSFYEDAIADEIDDAEQHLIDLGDAGPGVGHDELYREATRQFAHICRHEMPVRTTTSETFVLGVCCDALLAVLGDAQHDTGRALGRVMDHLRRYWERSNDAPDEPELRDAVMLAATFVGTDAFLLERALDILAIPTGPFGAAHLARWCRTMSSYGHAVQPDRLAELFVLDAAGSFGSPQVASSLPSRLVEHTLTLPDRPLAGAVALWSRVASTSGFTNDHPIHLAITQHWNALCERLIDVDGVTMTFPLLCRHLDLGRDTIEAALDRLPNPVTARSGAVETGLRQLHHRSLVALLGDRHPNTLTSLHNLANCYQAVGDALLALPLHEDCYQQHREVLGDRHPDTLGSLNNLANCYQAVGDPQRALALYEDCYQQHREVLGDRHPDTLGSLNNLALGYQAVGDLQRAVPLYEACHQQNREVLGDNHPNTLTSLNNLAYSYQAVGDPERALPLYEDCYQQRREVLGAATPTPSPASTTSPTATRRSVTRNGRYRCTRTATDSPVRSSGTATPIP